MKPSPPCPEICITWRSLTALGCDLVARLAVCDLCIAPWKNAPKPKPKETR